MKFKKRLLVLNHFNYQKFQNFYILGKQLLLFLKKLVHLFRYEFLKSKYVYRTKSEILHSALVMLANIPKR